jgi:hypothetical protein
MIRTIIAAIIAVGLGACSDNAPKCLVDDKDTGVVLEIEELCLKGRWNCNPFTRLRIERNSDKTICAMIDGGWKYKVGDKIRGPM